MGERVPCRAVRLVLFGVQGLMCSGRCTCASPCSSSSGSSPGSTTVTDKRILEHRIAPPEDWGPAPAAEARFRLTRFHHGDDGGFAEAVVPLRSLRSQLENFCRGDDLYGIWVTRL